VSGTLGERYGWHYGFLAAGAGMAIGLVIYLLAAPTLPPDVHTMEAADQRPLTREEWRAILALCVLFVPVSLFWATYEQAGNTISLWADRYADRSVFGLFTIPVTWFQAFNPFMIFAFTPFIIALWARQAMGNREPSSVVKMAYGCFYVAAANLVMVAAAALAGDGTASWLWLFAYFGVVTIGELYLSPTSLFARHQGGAGPRGVADDGGVARHQLRRRSARRLSRQLLERDGQERFLHDDCDRRRARRVRHPRDRAAGDEDPQALNVTRL
jgi:POT family proton-dependent oligopeptide transporter